jgi:aspartyl-tRNA(Asn)/glutamyl-tRNA(Gln) amidotransferase subunit A
LPDGSHRRRVPALDDLVFAPVADVGASIEAGRVSPVELTRQCLARIAALNKELNAFITVTTDLAEQQARDAEREIGAGRWRGPLHGVPVAVKDFYDTAGIRTTAAFEPFANRVPARDADMVVRLRDAGAVLVGKTNMHKLGMGTTSLDSYFGPVVSPWNARFVAGGSSGGSAVAVAAGMCFATVDTDAIGSGRLPASICGVTCLKPTFGVLPTAGILAGEQADPSILLLSHPCLTARNAADVALAFDALAGGDGAPARAVGAVRQRTSIRRVGVVANLVADQEVRAAFELFVARIRTLDIEAVPATVPFDAASFDVSGIRAHRAGIGALVFGDIDAIVLPTVTSVTPTVEDARAAGDQAVAADNTFFCNYFGLPAITVPVGLDQRGLPLGMQIVGPHGADHAVLGMARAYEDTVRTRYRPAFSA